MALLGSLVDNFRSPTLNTTLWNATNSAGNSGAQAGGRYTFIVDSGATGDATLASDVGYDLTGSHIHIELIDAGEQEAGLETYPIILTQNPANLTNSLFVVISNGTVGIWQSVAGVQTGLAFPSYNAVSMRWWRIREAGGTVYFETAPDVRGPWTLRASTPAPIVITSLFAVVRTFVFASLAMAKTTAISNVNYLAPPELPFPNGAIPVGMEIAFGADLDGDQSAWTWTDITPADPADGDSAFMNQTVTTTRGRQDEQSDVSPTSADVTLDNPDGDLTPDNPSSQYWPDVELGTPARWWVHAGDPRLFLRPVYGANATVEDTAALDLTADLDVRIDLHLKTTHPDGWNAILAGRADNGGGYSWRLEAQGDRQLTFFWSDDGTPPASELSSVVPILPMSARTVLRVTFDVDNGAGGHDLTFYLGESISGPWEQVGDVITGSGTTTIFNANENLVVGAPPDVSAVFALDADIYYFQLRDGINGTPIVDADFTAQVNGVDTFVDATGLVWSVNGAAELSDRWYRIVGTIDSWEPDWPWGDLSDQIPGGIGEGQARVDVQIAGILRRLGQGASPLESPLRRSIADEATLQGYWPFEDLKDSTQVASGIPGGTPATVVGAVSFADNDDLPGSKPTPTLSGTGGFSGSILGTFTGQWQADWYINLPAGPASPRGVMRLTGTGTIATWIVDLSAGAVTVTGLNSLGSVATTATSTPASFFGGWVHVRLFAEQDGSDVDWRLVWFPVTYPASSGFFIGNTFAGSVGGLIGWSVPADVLLDGMSMSHLAFLDAADLDASGGAATGWMGDTAMQRMVRLCREENVDLRVIGAAATTAKVGVQQVATLLDLLDDAADADGGILYEQSYSVGLIYRTRDSLYNQPPNVILDAHAEELQNPFRPILDDQRIRNDVTVTRRGGSSVQVIDQASIDKSGIYDESVTLNLFSDSQIVDAAGWRLHQGTVRGMRYASLTTNLGAAPQVIAKWLTADVGSRVHVTNLPPQHPNADVRVMLEGYSEPISPTTWEASMNCSPASVWDVTELDGENVSDEYLLRLETDGSEIAEAIDGNDTTMFVTVTKGPYWVTAPAEFPFDLRVGGERMTVTDINAAAGGEKFTGAGAYGLSASATFVAPSVVAPASGDLLICAWLSYQFVDTYTLPGGMTIAALTDGSFTSFEDATQALGAGGATGTKTATFGTADAWSAVSVVAHAASGTPTVVEYLDDVSAAGITLTTILPVAAGDWLLAFQGWDWDPGDNMAELPGGPWIPVADSVQADSNVSRIRAWAKQVTAANAGIQSVTFPVVGGINDNHARLYVLSGITGITQEFTVTRSINGVTRSHPAGTSIELWHQPVLAR